MSNQRIQNLEERLAWLERHVTEQDKAMLEIVDTLTNVRKELTLLRGRLATNDPGASESADDERPPHY